MKAEKLRALLALFADDDHWTQKSFVRDKHGETLLRQNFGDADKPPSYHKGHAQGFICGEAEPFCFCLDGGIRHTCCTPRDEHNIKTAIIEHGRVGHKYGALLIWDFNDHKDTTVEDIRKVIGRAIEISESPIIEVTCAG